MELQGSCKFAVSASCFTSPKKSGKEADCHEVTGFQDVSSGTSYSFT